jgi:large subunit ribosomal protein L15
MGKTSGRGHKGAHSRSGFSLRATYEGGQMPIFRRIPKRGFSNVNFRKLYQVVNVGALSDRFEEGATVDANAMKDAGLIRSAKDPIKILGDGVLRKKLIVSAQKFTRTGAKKIEASGGEIRELA